MQRSFPGFDGKRGLAGCAGNDHFHFLDRHRQRSVSLYLNGLVLEDRPSLILHVHCLFFQLELPIRTVVDSLSSEA